MKKRLFILGLACSFLLVGCNNDTPSIDEPDNPSIDDEPTAEINNLADFLKSIKETDNLTATVTGTSVDTQNKTFQVNKKLTYTPNLYLIEDSIDGINVKKGYYNANGFVGTYEINEKDEVIPLHKLSYDLPNNLYTDAILTLKDIEISSFENYDQNDYTFNLNANPIDPSTPANPYDYYNKLVIANAIQLHTLDEISTTVSMEFVKENEALNIYYKGDAKQNNLNLNSKYDLKIEVKLDANHVTKYEETLKTATFLEIEETSVFDEVIDLYEKGYAIHDYEVMMTDGSVSRGTIHSTKNYVCYDYSNEIMDLITGYYVANDELYIVQPSANGISDQLLLTKKDLYDFNTENHTNLTAMDFGRLVFQNTFGFQLIESTRLKEFKHLITQNSLTKKFYLDDTLNLYGVANEIDTNTFGHLVSPQTRPSGYYIDFKKNAENPAKSTIKYGYAYKYNLFGELETKELDPILEISNFGETNQTMEILVKRASNK